MAKATLINYSDITHGGAQRRNCDTGRRFGGFDYILPYNRCDLDDDFVKENKAILDQRRGAGYWLWKPWIINDALQSVCGSGDFLFYSDSGAEWIGSVAPLCDIMLTGALDIMLFHTDPLPGNKEMYCTKRDAFILMNCDSARYINGIPVHAGFQMYRKSPRALNFVTAYLDFCTDPRLITDQDNVLGQDNYEGFKFHRHDQSVLSLLAKKNNLRTFRDLTQWGNPYIDPQDGYGQIINHTRKFD